MTEDPNQHPPTKKPQHNSMAVLRDRGWISLRDFSHVADVSYQTALRWARLKMINYIQVGGVRRVYQEEIARFLKEGTLPADPILLQKEKDYREKYLPKIAANKLAKTPTPKY